MTSVNTPNSEHEEYDPEKTKRLERDLGEMKIQQRNLEKRLKGQSISGNIQDTATLVGAGAAGTAYFLTGLNKTAENFGKFVGEVGNSAVTISRLFEETSSGDYTDKQIQYIDENERDQYTDAHNQSFVSTIPDATKTVLDAGGRASENFPGAKTKPVQNIRGLKGKIIQATKGINPFAKKEEIAKTNTPVFQANYNELQRTEDQLTKKLSEFDETIEQYAEKMTINQAKNGKVDPETAEHLEKMVATYNDIHEFRAGLKDVSVNTLYEGMDNAEYAAIIGTAEDYGIEKPDFQAYGTGAVMAGAGAAIIAGGIAGKYVGKVARLGYETGRLAVKGTVGTAKGIKSLSQKGLKLIKSVKDRAKTKENAE